MKRVYLHIGRSKTGSTAIQRALASNRERLAALGFCYPGRGLDHSSLVHALRGSPECAEDAVDTLAEAYAAPGCVVISSEGLMLAPPQRVRDLLSGFSVKVIVYIREQAEASASAYQQEVKANLLSCSFEEYALPRHVDYERFLDRWSDVFGLENMSVRVYEQGAFAGGDLVADFLSALGVTDSAAFTADKSDANPSIAGALLEAKRRINACFPGTADELRAATYPRLLALANSRPEYRGRMRVSDATVDELRSRYEPTNAVVARKYLGRDCAFRPKPWPAVTPFTEDEVAEASAAIYLPDVHVAHGVRRGRVPREGYQRGWGLQYGELAQHLEAESLYRDALGAIGVRTVVSDARRKNLYLLMTQFLPRMDSRNIIEFGAYRGGNALFMALVMREIDPTAKIYALDTFAGMPATDKTRDAHNAGSFSDASLPGLQSRIEALELDNLIPVKGLFADTLPSVPGSFGMAHIDADIYESVKYAQDAVWPRMCAGGYVVFDDATESSCLGATEAVEELIQSGKHAEQIWPHFVFRAGL